VIPDHAGKTIKPKTLAAILDDMGISADELRELL
jgi:predicted RNA binding protein YcfA (HicA-like mRNA interferase family)